MTIANDVDDMTARWIAKGWKHVSCGCCAGLEWGGEEPRECKDCGGNGSLWQSPKGALALYPGGPFVGRVTP